MLHFSVYKLFGAKPELREKIVKSILSPGFTAFVKFFVVFEIEKNTQCFPKLSFKSIESIRWWVKFDGLLLDHKEISQPHFGLMNKRMLEANEKTLLKKTESEFPSGILSFLIV